MQSFLKFIKATVLGGVFFLVPIGMLVLLVSKIVPFMIAMEKKLGGAVETDSVAGLVALNLGAVLLVILLCFLAGLAAESKVGKSVIETLEDTVLGSIPVYTFIKGFTTDMRGNDEAAEGFTPVLVRFDDYSQVAFEIERVKDTGRVVIYLPGAPNPWSGSVIYVEPERVKELDVAVPQVVRNIKELGRGSSEVRDEVLKS